MGTRKPKAKKPRRSRRTASHSRQRPGAGVRQSVPRDAVEGYTFIRPRLVERPVRPNAGSVADVLHTGWQAQMLIADMLDVRKVGLSVRRQVMAYLHDQQIEASVIADLFGVPLKHVARAVREHLIAGG